MLDDTADVASINALGTRHRQAFVQALARVMETDVVERTLAEIIDGLPTIDSYQYFHWPQEGHPATQHLELCPAVDRYPNGDAHTVGYWAEAKIFGGVFVFDRGESETECNELYLHASRRVGPYTLFPLTTDQFERFVDFLLGDTEEHTTSRSPLPLRATSENRWRWHHWDTIARYHIFRDKYERNVQPTKPIGGVKSSVDWPEIADELYLIGAMHDYWDGQPVDKDKVREALEHLQQCHSIVASLVN
ncbi:hypothetical protein FBULB1_10326 [Fusarium bulbicola]|nr:hypothetical protein FBULB1_10326 [Fusarium bulbicola]